jgi:hypothetical protein
MFTSRLKNFISKFKIEIVNLIEKDVTKGYINPFSTQSLKNEKEKKIQMETLVLGLFAP